MTSTALEKQLLELEKQYWRAMQEGDVNAAMELTDDSCIVVGAQGVSKLDRQKLGAMLKQAPYRIDKYSIDDNAQVCLLNDDTAVLAYQVHEDLTVDGKPVKLDAADASTWVRRNGKWLCALHTESIAGDPFGRDRRAAS